ncbi:MAG: hypothetical protein IT340_21810 [Chloroflexi bacterium]|nr:hypothetical protein [Chloroflexota bacterium]
MTYYMVRITVKDYDHWRAIFDGRVARRQEASSRGSQIFRNRANPNEITILMELADADAYEAFASSPELREAMTRSGVIGSPEVAFLDLAARLEA